MIATAEIETDTMSKAPQTEIERQKTTVASLGKDFQFPLFNGRHAIESQRKSGYKNTARAAREIIDNAFESGARNVWLAFDRPGTADRAKHERKDSVSAIAFIDDGPGMIPEMARYALSWGGGTRFENPTGIGRFGFGLPNSSINQTRRVEVYTRTSAKQSWIRVVLDISPERLDKLPVTGLVSVDAPSDAPLPSFVTDYAKRHNEYVKRCNDDPNRKGSDPKLKLMSLATGTVVVWVKPDRLTARSAAKLKEMMLDDFGVVYRYLLEDFNLVVDGTAVKKVDPLFLNQHSLYYEKPEDGGATCTYDKELTVAYSRDPETGAQHLELLLSVDDVRQARVSPSVEGVGTVSVKISRFPVGFAGEYVETGGVKRYFAKDSDQYKRLQIRKKRRGVSFVRANREIDTVDVLPTTASDKASGLGDWPVLQGYALHWGIEVRFSPQLDEAFGIGNDKQTVNPIEDFWRVLVKAEVDRAARKEQKYQQEERERNDQEEAVRQATNPDQSNPATEAAAEAETAMGRNRPLPPERVEESRKRFEEAVDDTTKATGQTRDEAEEAVKREAAKKKYAIQFFDAEGGVFYMPDFGNGLQRVAKINRAHPFFKSFYADLVKLPHPQARQAVDLILLALAKAELEAGGDVKRMYEHQREAEWSTFLKLGFNILDQLQSGDPEAREEDIDP